MKNDLIQSSIKNDQYNTCVIPAGIESIYFLVEFLHFIIPVTYDKLNNTVQFGDRLKKLL